MHFAAAKNLGDFLEVILDDCGNPLAVAENGMSPFHVAFQLGRKDSAEVFFLSPTSLELSLSTYSHSRSALCNMKKQRIGSKQIVKG